MFDRDRDGADRRPKAGPPAGAPRRALRPRFESLEGRQLLTASLLPIGTVNSQQGVGVQVPLEAAPGTPNQTFTVTSDNPSIKAAVATGQFLTFNVTHTSSGAANDPSFSGPMVFQLFPDVAPIAVERISGLVNEGFYNNKLIFRVANMFPGPNDFIVQGGSSNNTNSGTITQPGFPFGNEIVPSVSFSNPGQLALANSGQPNTNGSQFFVTTGVPGNVLNEGTNQFTIFGQLVSGQNILNDMTQVSLDSSDGTTPVSPITITSATLANGNPDGVVHIDTTSATAGQTGHVTVTATDPSTGTTATQTFPVSVFAPKIPTLTPIPATQMAISPSQTTYSVQLQSSDTTPNAVPGYVVASSVSSIPSVLSGSVPSIPTSEGTATVSPTGLVTVTPAANFTGNIPLVVGVRNQFLQPGTTSLSDPANYATQTFTLQVGNQGVGIRLVGTTLAITPPPRTDRGTNAITIDEQNGSIVVTSNGTTNSFQPSASSVNQIVAFGSKAGDTIAVTPNVDPTIDVTLDGGHGGRNFLQGGAGVTTEHGWFGRTTMQGGSGTNSLYGLAGHVRFIKSAGNDVVIFAGAPGHVHHRGRRRLHGPMEGMKQTVVSPPTGTFYRFVGDRLVPLPTPKPPIRLRRAGSTAFTPRTRQLGFTAMQGQNLPNSGGSSSSGSGSSTSSG
jgi:cyclophilin family peptidyl-prolyl cis-trans isomerase